MDPSPSRPVALPREQVLFLAAFFLLLLPLCCLGYGSDNDTYGVLDAGRSVWQQHHLMTSRNPGYWTFEALTFALSQTGGYLLTNLASLAIATLILWRFLVLSARLGARYPLLLASCLAFTPVFVIASTATLDYLWSLLFIVLFVEALASGRPWRAMLLAAVAISFRAANGILIAGGFAFAIGDELLQQKRISRRVLTLAATGILSAVLGGLTFLLSAYLVHWTMAFTAGYMGPAPMWTLKMRAGRFVYKGLYLFGPIGTVILALAVVLRPRSPADSPRARLQNGQTHLLAVIALGVLLGNLALFWKFPIEVSYAIPAAFFFLLLAGGTYLASAKRTLIVLSLAILSLNFVLFSLAEPNIPGMATGARLHFSITEGTLVQDVRDRIAVISCRSNACWMEHGTLPGH